MEVVTFWRCARDAWSEGGRFVQHKPLAVAIGSLALLACDIVSVVLSHSHRPFSPISASPILEAVILLVSSVVVTALPIQVMQEIILGEREPRTRPVFGREFWRYLALCLTIGLGCTVLASVVIGGGFLLTDSFGIHFIEAGSQWVVWGVIALCLVTFVATRLSLLFCHVAIGRAIRWRAAWHDTRGHFWLIFVSHFLTIAPLNAFVIVVSTIDHVSFETTNRRAIPYLLAVGTSLCSSAGLIVSATCACWLYQRLARTLLARS
jgi:hypothetical protein